MEEAITENINKGIKLKNQTTVNLPSDIYLLCP